MTIHKATIITIIMQALTTDTNIDSWCQIVLDLLDLMFAELFYGFYKEHLETQTPSGLSQLPSDLHTPRW